MGPAAPLGHCNMPRARGEGITEYSLGHVCMYDISPMRHLIGILCGIWLSSGWHPVGIWLASGWHLVGICLALVWHRIGQNRIGLFSYPNLSALRKWRCLTKPTCVICSCMFRFSLLILYDTCSLSHYNLSRFGNSTTKAHPPLPILHGQVQQQHHTIAMVRQIQWAA